MEHARQISANVGLPTGREVLVAEDELRIRNMLREALPQMGYNATLVPNAEAAARAMEERDFDILILDLNLPGMSGMEFFEALRRKRHDLQVIVLTGFGDLEAAKKAIHLDVVDFLGKPCALGSLELALERARLRRRGQVVGQPGSEPRAALQFESPPARRQIVVDPPDQPADQQVSMEEIECRHILSVLEKHGGNRAATAAELGISLRKLYYRLGEYQKKGRLNGEPRSS